MNRKIQLAILCLILSALIFALHVTDVGKAETLCVMQVFASGGLRVRSEPGLDGNAVYLLENRETVIVIDEADGWYLVGKNIPPHVELGWVCGDYLK